MRTSACSLVLVLLVAAVCGCSSTDSTSSGGGESGATGFAAEVQPIFTASCASAVCHGQAGHGSLELTSGDSYDNLVNVASSQVPDQMRVLPGDAANSYLVTKLNDGPPVGVRMPKNAGPLSADDLQTITDWINSGAPND